MRLSLDRDNAVLSPKAVKGTPSLSSSAACRLLRGVSLPGGYDVPLAYFRRATRPRIGSGHGRADWSYSSRCHTGNRMVKHRAVAFWRFRQLAKKIGDGGTGVEIVKALQAVLVACTSE